MKQFRVELRESVRKILELRAVREEQVKYTGIAEPVQMQFWASREGRLFDVATIIAKNEARAYAARHRLQWLADTPMDDEDTRASRATTPTKMTAERERDVYC